MTEPAETSLAAREIPGQESLSMLVGEALGHLHRLRRPLLGGISAVLAVVLGVLVSPLSGGYVGTATLAVPANPGRMPDKGESGMAGIGVGDFRLLIRSLQDPDTLAGYFPLGPDPKKMARRIPQLVTPIFAVDVSAATPIAADARVLAIELAASSSAEQSSLASLDRLTSTEQDTKVFLDHLTTAVRDALANLFENEWLKQARTSAAAKREGLMARIQTAEREHLGYLKLGATLSQIPNAAGAASGLREVVDTNGGGHRYLPLPVQLNGVRVAIAELENDLRLARAEMIEVNALDAFVGRVNTRAASSGRATNPVVNVSAIIAEEAEALEAATDVAPMAKAQVLERVKSTVDFFRVRRAAMDLIQKPTIRFNRNYTLPVAFGLLGLLTWFGVVLLRDSWKRHGARAYDAADRDAQTS